MALSTPLKISRVEAFPIRLPRNLDSATGTAGSPTSLSGDAGAYRWSSAFPTLYSEYIETALIKITLNDGAVGWGEAQAPLAPRVPATIVEDLLAPVVVDSEFDGSRRAIEGLWNRMYQTMRVRGQTSGFMIDAISGVDLALWDLAGKLQDAPVASLMADGEPTTQVPVYLSGVSGSDVVARAEFAQSYAERGFNVFKIFFDSGPESLLDLIDAMRERLGETAGIALDALWRLELPGSEALLEQLSSRKLYWLECPFYPDEFEPHQELVQRYGLPLAVGESYRTLRELEPFFSSRLLKFIQPDLGRSGITETLRIGRLAATQDVELVPHVSIALGPQIAAAIHTAAAIPNCRLCEYNPSVFGLSNRYLADPLRLDGAAYSVPTLPGLGVEIREKELLNDCLGF